jgi:hypothetical protein
MLENPPSREQILQSEARTDMLLDVTIRALNGLLKKTLPTSYKPTPGHRRAATIQEEIKKERAFQFSTIADCMLGRGWGGRPKRNDEDEHHNSEPLDLLEAALPLTQEEWDAL